MFTVNLLAGAIDTLELADSTTKSVVMLAPARGGIMTKFKVGTREALYLDEATLNDPAANVRGGCPVLFPSPGKIEGDAYEHEGTTYPMAQHGFARTMPWEIARTGTAEGATATLRLSATDDTRAVYPFDFVVEITYLLRGAKLRIESKVRNDGTTKMPFALGFHPYFLIPQEEKPGARIETSSTRAWDNIKKEIVFNERPKLACPEVDMHLLSHGTVRTAITWADTDRLTLEAAGGFTRWVIWTVAGKDFVCLEPWTAGGGALASGDGVIWLEPGESKSLTVTIAPELKEPKVRRQYQEEAS